MPIIDVQARPFAVVHEQRFPRTLRIVRLRSSVVTQPPRAEVAERL